MLLIQCEKCDKFFSPDEKSKFFAVKGSTEPTWQGKNGKRDLSFLNSCLTCCIGTMTEATKEYFGINELERIREKNEKKLQEKKNRREENNNPSCCNLSGYDILFLFLIAFAFYKFAL